MFAESQQKHSGMARESELKNRITSHTKLILDFQWRVKELVHDLKGLLLIFKEPAAINALEINVEETLGLAAFQQLLNLFGLLRKQTREVYCLHRIDRHLLSTPLHCLWNFACNSHDGGSSLCEIECSVGLDGGND